MTPPDGPRGDRTRKERTMTTNLPTTIREIDERITQLQDLISFDTNPLISRPGTAPSPYHKEIKRLRLRRTSLLKKMTPTT